MRYFRIFKPLFKDIYYENRLFNLINIHFPKALGHRTFSILISYFSKYPIPHSTFDYLHASQIQLFFADTAFMASDDSVCENLQSVRIGTDSDASDNILDGWDDEFDKHNNVQKQKDIVKRYNNNDETTTVERKLQLAKRLIERMKEHIIPDKRTLVDKWITDFENDKGRCNLFNNFTKLM